jgi:YidC/Oxa1 family membrane protein insertase
MDSQRPFLYLTLAFLLFLIWTSWQQDHAPKPVTAQTTAATNTATANTPATSTAAGEEIPATATPQSAAQAIANPAQAATAAASQMIHIKTDVLDIQITTQGGAVVQADLTKFPVSLEEPNHAVRILNLTEKGYAAQSGLIHSDIAGVDKSTLAPNHNALFTAQKTEYILGADQVENSLVVPLTWTNGQGITVTKTYTFKKGSYVIEVEDTVVNQSNQTWMGYNYRRLRHAPVGGSSAGAMLGVQAYVGAAYFDEKYIKYSFSDMDDEALQKSIQGGWISMIEHYFVSAWVPNASDKDASNKNEYFSKVYRNNGVISSYTIGVSSPIKQIASGASDSFKSQLYIGPKDQKVLGNLSEGLDLTVDYGILSFISKPLFWLLQLFHSLLGNWGWAIIFVTLAIKILFFYPSALSYKSMAKMKKLAPQLKSLNERYKNDPQGKQKAMMAMYKKEKVNPLGGCLPMLIQIPVFMGLYWVLMESVELRQAPWMLWYQDLSVMDPYLILPVLMGASMWFQQKLNPSQMDPMQQKIFQYLPVVFTVMFLWFPAGLVLYWLVNNLLSIAQQWYINKQIIGHG